MCVIYFYVTQKSTRHSSRCQWLPQGTLSSRQASRGSRYWTGLWVPSPRLKLHIEGEKIVKMRRKSKLILCTYLSKFNSKCFAFCGIFLASDSCAHVAERQYECKLFDTIALVLLYATLERCKKGWAISLTRSPSDGASMSINFSSQPFPA